MSSAAAEVSAPPVPFLTVMQPEPATNLAEKLHAAFELAIAGQGKLDTAILRMEGMSGKKYRLLINNLIGAVSDARYLEVGSWAGSTLCSAIWGNSVRAMAIDNWALFGGPSQKFFGNLSKFKTADAKVSFLEADFRSIDFSTIGKYNIYLYDGPHSVKDQYDGIKIAQPALEDSFVLIVDDWNREGVREGTTRVIRDLGLRTDWRVDIRTTLDGTDAPSAYKNERGEWHNGYFIAALSKVGVSPAAY